MKDLIRRCIFRPYRKGMGPVFSLTMWDTHKRPEKPRTTLETYLGYCLRMDGKVLFEGDDYRCSPADCIDSDASVEGIVGFLTLRPGDTDDEYFEKYTQAQLDYCANHAEALCCEVISRFGED